MEISQLQAFRTLANVASYNEASKVLGKSHSTVSRQIKQLERILGVKLFERTGGKYVLSNHGKLLLPRAEEIFGELETLQDIFSERTKDGEEHLTIGTNLSSATNPFLQFRAKFLEIRPDSEVFLKKYKTEMQALQALLERRVDIVVRTSSSQLDERLSVLNLGNATIVAVCASDHPLWSKGKEMSNQFVQDETLVMLSGTSQIQEVIDDFLERRALNFKRIYRVDSSAIARGVISGGTGIGFLPKWSVTEEIDKGSLIEVNLPEQIEFALQYVFLANESREIVKDFIRVRSMNPPNGVVKRRSAHK